MNLKLNKYLLFFITLTALHGENVKYASFDLHTLTIPKNQITISASYLAVNEQLDFLNLKDSSLSENQALSSIGDLSGFELGIMYGITNNLMMNYKITRSNIEYNNDSFVNTKNEIYARYNMFAQTIPALNSGFSLDVGFINNRLNNFYVTDINDINALAQRYFPDKDITIQQETNGALSLYEGNTYDNLNYYPWVGLEDTSDNSLYLRALTGFKTKNGLFDFFAGVKRTRISNSLTANDELIEIAISNDYTVEKDLARDETMYFAGTSMTYQMQDFVFEFMYEYDKFQRESGLDYIDSNHVVDLGINYAVTKNMMLFTSAKMMYRQLNGQIPYLYNEYTQTTYDHTYGYAKFGILYNF